MISNIFRNSMISSIFRNSRILSKCLYQFVPFFNFLQSISLNSIKVQFSLEKKALEEYRICLLVFYLLWLYYCFSIYFCFRVQGLGFRAPPSSTASPPRICRFLWWWRSCIVGPAVQGLLQGLGFRVQGTPITNCITPKDLQIPLVVWFLQCRACNIGPAL